MASFIQRLLEVRITLREGEFAGGGNTKIVTDIPIRAAIEKTGPPDFCKATVEIRGMKYDDMATLSTLSFRPLTTAKNVIEVYAGDRDSGMALAFEGEVTSASADFNAAPDVSFRLECMAGYFGNVTPKAPTAVSGSQKAADFIAMMAREAGYAFRNDGVEDVLTNAIFSGSPVLQARSAARQVGAELIIDDGVMILGPSGGRQGNAVLLSASSGLLGYPAITGEGVELKAIYNPAFRLGGHIKLETIVPRAEGVWRIIKLSHELTAFDPTGGPWESAITGFYPGEEKKK